MDTKAFDALSKVQVIDLIVWQMLKKSISLDELTAGIKGKEKKIFKEVNEHLRKNMGGRI